MKYLSEKYIKVFNYRGFDICTLKIANPENGDKLGYTIDSEIFKENNYEHPDNAIEAIEIYLTMK